MIQMIQMIQMILKNNLKINQMTKCLGLYLYNALYKYNIVS